MIPVTDLVDRQVAVISHLGRDGAIALPRAVRAVPAASAVVFGAIGALLLEAINPGWWFWGLAVGGAAGWAFMGWSPDETSQNVPEWLLVRLRARQGRSEVKCLGAGEAPTERAPNGGWCAACNKIRPLDDDGGIVSCGTRARVFVGLAMVRQASGVPVEIGGGLVRVEQTEDDDFAGRSLR